MGFRTNFLSEEARRRPGVREEEDLPVPVTRYAGDVGAAQIERRADKQVAHT